MPGVSTTQLRKRQSAAERKPPGSRVLRRRNPLQGLSVKAPKGGRSRPREGQEQAPDMSAPFASRQNRLDE